MHEGERGLGPVVARRPRFFGGRLFGRLRALGRHRRPARDRFTAWKVTTARSLARQSGMDPGLATQLTLLTEDGLDATYLAANLREPHAAGSVASPVGSEPQRADAAQRLTELKSLMEQGLVTPTEYEERRRAIIETV
jgi:hypothetical protein